MFYLGDDPHFAHLPNNTSDGLNGPNVSTDPLHSARTLLQEKGMEPTQMILYAFVGFCACGTGAAFLAFLWLEIKEGQERRIQGEKKDQKQ